MLKIIPLGVGEIGLNMMVVEYRDSILVIDAGLMFPEDSCWAWTSSFRTWNTFGKTGTESPE